MISENLVVINFLAVVWSMFLIVLSMHFQCAPTALPKHDYHTRALRRLRFRRARTAFSKRKSHARTFRRWRAQATSLRVVKGLRRSRLRHRTSNIAQATVRDWILNFPRDVCGGFDAPLATSQDGGFPDTSPPPGGGSLPASRVQTLRRTPDLRRPTPAWRPPRPPWFRLKGGLPGNPWRIKCQTSTKLTHYRYPQFRHLKAQTLRRTTDLRFSTPSSRPPVSTSAPPCAPTRRS